MIRSALRSVSLRGVRSPKLDRASMSYAPSAKGGLRMGQYAKGAANTRPATPRPTTLARSAKVSAGAGSPGIVSGGARGPSPLGKATMVKPHSASMRTSGPSPSGSVAYNGRKK